MGEAVCLAVFPGGRMEGLRRLVGQIRKRWARQHSAPPAQPIMTPFPSSPPSHRANPPSPPPRAASTERCTPTQPLRHLVGQPITAKEWLLQNGFESRPLSGGRRCSIM